MWGTRILGGLCSGAALALTSVWAADLPVTSAVYSLGGGPQEAVLAAYRDLSSSRSRNYDRTQDISPRQMVILLEVAERTGASLGQALATGEHESARTWNDHVRPTLQSGSLGSAAGVWQFVPATFHAIVKKYGARLLDLSAADAVAGRGPLDLGEGPFSDAEVRGLIQETVDGQRGVDDEKLQLLRHNFAVLAFAKHYLSLDTGATTPEEDYLFHFLGAGQGRRVLELARGEARNTLSVKPVETPLEPLGPPGSELAAADPRMALRKATSLVPALPPAAVDPAVDPVVGPPVMRLRIRGEAESSAAGGKITTIQSQTGLPPMRPMDLGSTTIPPFSFAPPPVSSEWGLPADSPTVTGNLGMFYRDGKGQTQPYTWGEFMEHLARRVRADQQPAMVRAKYGVGFSLNGGDLPHWAVNPEKLTKAGDFRHRHGRSLPVPEALVTGPLNQDEAEHYKQRLGALVNQGDDQPTESLPPEALSALQHLGLLPERVQELSTTHPEVRDALHEFRKRVGKDQPDDSAHSNRLMPAERIALEIYDRRLAHYAGLQACQEASSADAPDLKRISKLPIGLQRPTAPHVALVQKALAAQGLLKQPTKKQVWRDKKRKKHVVYKTLHFAGKVDKATIAALNTFQLRNGLRRTDGVLDAVTLELLGLPAMGPEIFLPLSGPQCAIQVGTETAHLCQVRASIRPNDLGVLSPTRASLAPSWWSVMRGGDCSGPPVESS